MSIELSLEPVSTTAQPRSVAAVRVSRRTFDYLAIVAAWGIVVAAASVFPLDDPRVHRVALFVHLMSMAVGFGAVVLIDVFGVQWLFGRRSLAELADLAASAHPVIAAGLGGLLGSGIALHPDLSAPLARLKLVLVLVVMINGVVAQGILHRLRDTLPPETSGASIPWAGFQRALAVGLISQATWWGSIAIGFITNGNRAS
jgi:hypothetical protein